MADDVLYALTPDLARELLDGLRLIRGLLRVKQGRGAGARSQGTAQSAMPGWHNWVQITSATQPTEVQAIFLKADGGYWTITGSTAHLTTTETVANVQAAARTATGLSVTVTGSAGGPYTVTWPDTSAHALLAVDGSHLTDGHEAGSVTVREVTPGGDGRFPGQWGLDDETASPPAITAQGSPGDILVRPEPGSATLSTGKWYWARLEGPNSDGAKPTYVVDMSSGDNGIEVSDHSSDFTGVHHLLGDAAGVLTFTQPAPGEAQVVFTDPGSTYETYPGLVSYTGITLTEVDTTDGLTLTNPSTGVARIGLQAAGALANGAVTTSAQTFSGVKSFDNPTVEFASDGTYTPDASALWELVCNAVTASAGVPRFRIYEDTGTSIVRFDYGATPWGFDIENGAHGVGLYSYGALVATTDIAAPGGNVWVGNGFAYQITDGAGLHTGLSGTGGGGDAFVGGICTAAGAGGTVAIGTTPTSGGAAGGILTDSGSVVDELATGTNGDVLTMVSGAPAWAPNVSGAGGADTQVLYNASGVETGNANLTWDYTNQTLGVIGGTGQYALKLTNASSNFKVYFCNNNGTVVFDDGATEQIVYTGTANGTVFGSTGSDKLAFWGAAPTTQPNSTGYTTLAAAGATSPLFNDTTSTGGVGATAYTYGDLVANLKAAGILAV